MRSPLRSLNPVQLLGVFGISSAVMTSTVIVILLKQMHGHRPIASLGTILAIGLLFYLVPFFLIAHCESILRRGVESSRWSDTELATAHKIVMHPAIKILAGLLLLLALYGPLYLLIRYATLSGGSLLLTLVFIHGSIQRIKDRFTPKQPMPGNAPGTAPHSSY